jgi:hypothetical protein
VTDSIFSETQWFPSVGPFRLRACFIDLCIELDRVNLLSFLKNCNYFAAIIYEKTPLWDEKYVNYPGLLLNLFTVNRREVC